MTSDAPTDHPITTRIDADPISQEDPGMTEPSAPSAPRPAFSRRALGIGICTGVVAIAFEAISVATALPRAAEELGGKSLYAWNYTLFVIGMMVANVVAGRIADRVGPLRPLAFGMLVFAIGLLVAGSATAMPQLLTGRAIQGVGAGALNLGLFVVIARAFVDHQRAVMMTWLSSAWVVPAFIGPPISAWITETFSWHWVFYGVVPLVVIATVVALRPMLTLQRSGALDPTGVSNPVPLWAGLVVALGAAGVQYAGQQLEHGFGWRVVVIAVVAIGLLAISLPPLMPPGFLRLRVGLPSVIWTRAIVAGSFFGAEAFIPLMLVERRGLSLQLAGVILTVGAIGWFTGSWLQSRTWLKISRQGLITLGAISVLLGLAGISVVIWFDSVWVGVAGLVWVFGGLGMGLSIASTSLAMMTFSPVSEQGRNSSSLQVGESIGNALLAGISGTVFAALHTAHPQQAFGTLTLVMVCFAVVGVLVSRRIGPVAPPAG